jgi:hypothetical protein
MRNARAGTAATGDGGPVNRPDEHDALLLGLTLVAALTDGISYLGLAVAGVHGCVVTSGTVCASFRCRVTVAWQIDLLALNPGNQYWTGQGVGFLIGYRHYS